MPCLSLPAPPTPVALPLSGPRVTYQKSTSDLVILTLRTCCPLCYNEVQLPHLDTAALQALISAPLSSLGLILLPSPTLPGPGHPKPQEQSDTETEKRVWSQPGCSSHLPRQHPCEPQFPRLSYGNDKSTDPVGWW